MILYSGENIKLKVSEKFSENNLIRCYWEKVTKSVGNEDLKDQVDRYKGEGFHKNMGPNNKEKVVRSGSLNDGRQEMAMRKTLSTSSQKLEKGQPFYFLPPCDMWILPHILRLQSAQVGLKLTHIPTVIRKFVCFDTTSHVNIKLTGSSLYLSVWPIRSVGRLSERQFVDRGFKSRVGLTLYLKTKIL